jgi:hypothetical protein
MMTSLPLSWTAALVGHVYCSGVRADDNFMLYFETHTEPHQSFPVETRDVAPDGTEVSPS